MAKKKGQAYYKKKATELAKTMAKERDNYTCQYCGVSRDTRQIQASHVYGVGQKPYLSAEMNNIKAMCAYHHKYWWHAQIIEATEWFKKKFPHRDKYLKQKIKEHDENPLKKVDWEETYNKLKKLND